MTLHGRRSNLILSVRMGARLLNLTYGMTSHISFRSLLAVSALLRIGLVVYSDWHDAHSLVKYTDVDYRVFSDATRFLLRPGTPEGNVAEGLLGATLNLGR